jgi:Putative abortive phage resistance protein AbiGi, antitoxin
MPRVEQPPGTVSKILWHFTGGPKWNSAKNRQGKLPRPASEAYTALLSILKSKQLRLGQYQEVVKVEVPEQKKLKPKANQPPASPSTKPATRIVEVKSARVCCIADIPVAHLSYQAKRYGKIAIGFHRRSHDSA